MSDVAQRTAAGLLLDQLESELRRQGVWEQASPGREAELL